MALSMAPSELKERLLDDADHAQASRERDFMSLSERLLLSPWEKWKLHRRVPYKMLLHLLLLTLSLLQLLIYNSQNAAYMRASHRNWAFFFLPDTASGVSSRYQRDFFQLNETRDAVAFIRDAYFSIADVSIANYELRRNSQRQVWPIYMALQPKNRQRPTQRFELNASSLGPFDNAQSSRALKKLVSSVDWLHLQLFLRDRQTGSLYDECFDWRIELHMRLIENSRMRLELEDCGVATCLGTSFWGQFRQRYLWLNVLMISTSVVYMTLSLKALLRSISM